MRENVKPDGTRAISAETHARRSAGARLARAQAATAANDMIARADVIHLAPAQSGKTAPVGGLSKRAFDLLLAMSALVVLLPLLLVIALIVRLESPGPAIFKQERGGYRGKTFRIWKFRTMNALENRGVVQAIAGDARLTRIGGFLRRSSLDELPQLVNVLIGDMSLVGPRPHALEHDVRFAAVDPRYPTRFAARPGVTGLAQVNGSRGPTETEDKITTRTGFDVEYVQAWSWGRELDIIGRTAALLLRADPRAF